ncbi:hypothetical protein SAMN04487983_102096 [Streptomyces sp. yr375]|uniref:hypothetical protein n=1 Tax=Streptomyces sp. yr375 TaxID=1761906 RepID=UPI0008C62AF5|nr:hypothetical protein [Streptomyces sp. yr375]SER69424.1 hypothetical protein SAMN04487983_102096 [Streptomyces sp. yr375]
MNAWNQQGGRPPYDPYQQPNQPYPPNQPYGPPPVPPFVPRVGLVRRVWRAVGPIAVGRKVFRPSRPGRVDDPVVARMQKIRTGVGLAAVVWVVVSYQLARSVGDFANDRVNQSWNNVLVLSVTFPVVVGVLIGVARPPARQELLRRAVKPFGSVVAIIAAVGVFPVFVLTGFADGRFATNPVTTAVTVLVMLLAVGWILPFVVYGIGLSLVHVFRTADIHETVPPLLALVLVWEMALLDLVTGAYEGAPVPVRIGLVLGAPLSVTAVALWELRRLRVGYGLTLRGALMR